MELQIFNFSNHDVRTVVINDEPYFVGKDVAEILGYSDLNKALVMHVDDEDKKLNDKSSPSFGQRGATLINESGLYSLVLSSKLPQAKKFKRWVTSEVLPTLRKTGGYTVPQTYAQALRELADISEQKEKLLIENEQMKPLALFANAVDASEDSILIGQLAKILSQNGYKIGQNRLFEWLRENGFLCTTGEKYNMPTQKSMNMKLMEIMERTIDSPDGKVKITKTTKITGKGQIYFINKFCDDNEEAIANVI